LTLESDHFRFRLFRNSLFMKFINKIKLMLLCGLTHLDLHQFGPKYGPSLSITWIKYMSILLDKFDHGNMRLVIELANHLMQVN